MKYKRKNAKLRLAISYPFLMLFLLFCYSLKGQSNDPDIQLQNYFKAPRESIYLHLNKSVFLVGEHIWFSGYVYDKRKGQPFKETTNLHVSLHDNLGKTIKKKVFLAKEGYAHGQLKIDTTYVQGTYYVRATTKWMQNFKEDDSFVQKIEVKSKNSKEAQQQPIENYDVQLLPEGGHLIADIKNTIGVKILDSLGYGVQPSKAEVFDKAGKLLTGTKLFSQGMGKFELIPSLSSSHEVLITFPNGQTVSQVLPKALKKGININLTSNPQKKQVGFVFRTNNGTRSLLKDKSFYFLIHKDGNAKKVEFSFADGEDPTFFLDLKTLDPGVNTITLFNDAGKPILERLFFNSYGVDQNKVTLLSKENQGDSIVVRLKSTIPNTVLSVSVLPQRTKAYDHKDNILSAFLLKPYLSGFVENPGYYFEDFDSSKEYQLDLLLLNQGWSRYRWDNIFAKETPIKNDFEDGFVLLGTLNAIKYREKDNILVHGTKNHPSQSVPIDFEKKQFILHPYFPENGETLRFSLQSKNGKLTKPNMYVKVLGEPLTRSLDPWPNKVERAILNGADGDTQEILLTDDIIVLDEVTVVENKKQSLAESNGNIPEFIKRYTTEVDTRTVQDFPLVQDLIRAQGYDVVETTGFVPTVLIQSRRGGVAKIILDGIVILPGELGYFINLPVGQIESFWVDRLSRFEGLQSQNQETIYLYTRRGPELGRDGKFIGRSIDRTFDHVVKKGYEAQKEFYTPTYRNYGQEFENYGVIHWEPNLRTDTNGLTKFKMLAVDHIPIRLFVEGMSTSGKLVSKKLLIAD